MANRRGALSIQSEKQLVGKVAVDAGVLMISDPGYVLHKGSLHKGFGRSWSEFVGKLVGKPGERGVTQIGKNVAVVVGGFGGDGVYPVYVRRDRRGLVCELSVRFDETGNGENDG